MRFQVWPPGTRVRLKKHLQDRFKISLGLFYPNADWSSIYIVNQKNTVWYKHGGCDFATKTMFELVTFEYEMVQNKLP